MLPQLAFVFDVPEVCPSRKKAQHYKFIAGDKNQLFKQLRINSCLGQRWKNVLPELNRTAGCARNDIGWHCVTIMSSAKAFIAHLGQKVADQSRFLAYCGLKKNTNFKSPKISCWILVTFIAEQLKFPWLLEKERKFFCKKKKKKS